MKAEIAPASFILWSNVGQGGANGRGIPWPSSPLMLVGEQELQGVTVLAKEERERGARQGWKAALSHPSQLFSQGSLGHRIAPES